MIVALPAPEPKLPGKQFRPGYSQWLWNKIRLSNLSCHQRQYIVANTDIAPTILDFFQIKNADNSMIGRAIHSIGVDEESTLERAQQLAHSTSTTTRLRTPLIKGYVGSLIIILLLASIIILKYRSYQFLLKPVIIAMVSFPLVLLFLGLLRLPHDYLYIFVAIVATIIITILALALSRGNGFRAFIALSFITLWAINLDVLTGTTLIQCSVLGYDPWQELVIMESEMSIWGYCWELL